MKTKRLLNTVIVVLILSSWISIFQISANLIENKIENNYIEYKNYMILEIEQAVNILDGEVKDNKILNIRNLIKAYTCLENAESFTIALSENDILDKISYCKNILSRIFTENNLENINEYKNSIIAIIDILNYKNYSSY